MSAPFDYFSYQNGKLSVQDLPLAELAEKYGTPLYVYSSEALLAPLRSLQKGLKGLDHLVCFAVKANSNLAVLNLLAESGAGTDLVSGGELFRAVRAGVPPARIVFSGVGKRPEEMQEALKHDIFSFNVESVAELELLNEVALQAGKIAPVALRYNPDVDAKTHPYISTGLKKNKFGLERGEVLDIGRRLGSMPGIHLLGLSIHIGSQLLSLSPLEDAFLRLKKMRAALEKVIGRPLEVLDLGGGVGITYKAGEKPPSIERYCKLIQKHFAPKRGEAPVKIVIEPGRSLSGNAGVLLTKILYRKPRGKKDFVVVDAAMNDLARPALYGSFHDIVPVSKRTKSASGTVDIVGPVCESTDCFATNRKLPKAIDRGDLLAVMSAGAYGFSMSSNYNTRPRPPEILVHEGEAHLIRPRETLEDLIRGEVIPGEKQTQKGERDARNLHSAHHSLHPI